MDVQAAWEDMDAALALQREASEATGDGSGEHDARDDDEDSLASRADAARAQICRLANGDIHVCGWQCPSIRVNDDGLYVCQLTGLTYGTKCERKGCVSDTGRSMWSIDPDNSAGGAPVGGWRRKRSSLSLSNTAYQLATKWTDADDEQDWNNTLARSAAAEAARPAPTVRATGKRGALCVDVSQEPQRAADEEAAKRQRIAKRVGDFASLHKETMQTLERLVRPNRGLVVSNRYKAAGCKPLAPAHVADERLLDEAGLFTAAVRKYVKQCTARGAVPSIDDLHNLGLAVRAVAQQEQAKQRAAREAVAAPGNQLVHSARFKTLASTLVVELWHAACCTPYFAHARRGTDSFRPFAAGALYAFKRGLTLPNASGTLLVPPVPEFAAALPTARAIGAADPVVRSLHASSHRGLCSIHRCLASVPVEQLDAVFGRALRIAERLVHLTARRCAHAG
jgi:hypothetical protein